MKPHRSINSQGRSPLNSLGRVVLAGDKVCCCRCTKGRMCCFSDTARFSITFTVVFDNRAGSPGNPDNYLEEKWTVTDKRFRPYLGDVSHSGGPAAYTLTNLNTHTVVESSVQSLSVNVGQLSLDYPHPDPSHRWGIQGFRSGTLFFQDFPFQDCCTLSATVTTGPTGAPSLYTITVDLQITGNECCKDIPNMKCRQVRPSSPLYGDCDGRCDHPASSGPTDESSSGVSSSSLYESSSDGSSSAHSESSDNPSSSGMSSEGSSEESDSGSSSPSSSTPSSDEGSGGSPGGSSDGNGSQPPSSGGTSSGGSSHTGYYPLVACESGATGPYIHADAIPSGSDGCPEAESGSSAGPGSPPPTTVKYGGACYHLGSRVEELPAGATLITPDAWWADCASCETTCQKCGDCCFSREALADIHLHFAINGGGAEWDVKTSNAVFSPANCMFAASGDDVTHSFSDSSGTVEVPYIFVGYGNGQWSAPNAGYIDNNGGHDFPTMYLADSVGEYVPVTGDCTGASGSGSIDIVDEFGWPMGTCTYTWSIRIRNNTCCKDGSGNCRNEGWNSGCGGDCPEEGP